MLRDRRPHIRVSSVEVDTRTAAEAAHRSARHEPRGAAHVQPAGRTGDAVRVENRAENGGEGAQEAVSVDGGSSEVKASEEEEL